MLEGIILLVSAASLLVGLFVMSDVAALHRRVDRLPSEFPVANIRRTRSVAADEAPRIGRQATFKRRRARWTDASDRPGR